MIQRISQSSRLVLMLAVLVVSSVAVAQAPAPPEPLVSVRLESLDAGVATLDRIGDALGKDLSGQLLAGLDESGLRSLIDTKRPVSVVLPFAGMMNPQQGFVAAIPVASEAAVLAEFAIEGEAAPAPGSVVTLPGAEGWVLVVRDGYALVAQNQALFAAVDVAALESRGTLPPGPVAASVYLEPIAPVILQQAAMMKELSRQKATAGQGDGEEAPAGAGAEAMAQEFGFTFLEALARNVSRYQISVNGAADDLELHTRLVPKGGSTLERFVAAQKAGGTELAALLPRDANVRTNIGFVFTSEVRSAWVDMLSGYFDLMGTMAPELAQSADAEGTEDASPVSPQEMIALGRSQSELAKTMVRCMTGEVASAVTMTEETLVSLQVARVDTAAEDCKDLPSLYEKGFAASLESVASLSDKVLIARKTVAGISALEFRMRAEFPVAGDSTPAPLKNLLQQGLGSLTAQVGDVVLTAAGADAEAVLAAGIKRLQSGASRTSALASSGSVEFDLATFARSMGGEEVASKMPAGAKLDGDVRFDGGAMSTMVRVPFGVLAAFVPEESAEGGEGAGAEPAE